MSICFKLQYLLSTVSLDSWSPIFYLLKTKKEPVLYNSTPKNILTHLRKALLLILKHISVTMMSDKCGMKTFHGANIYFSQYISKLCVII